MLDGRAELLATGVIAADLADLLEHTGAIRLHLELAAVFVRQKGEAPAMVGLQLGGIPARRSELRPGNDAGAGRRRARHGELRAQHDGLLGRLRCGLRRRGGRGRLRGGQGDPDHIRLRRLACRQEAEAEDCDGETAHRNDVHRGILTFYQPDYPSWYCFYPSIYADKSQ